MPAPRTAGNAIRVAAKPNDTNASNNAGGAQTTGSGPASSASNGMNPATGGDNQPSTPAPVTSKDSNPDSAMSTENGATPSGITRD